MDSHRYWTFDKKGTICSRCGLKGKYFAKEKCKQAKGYHFNLYGVNEIGEEILFTNTLTIPKSKGGVRHISNYNTMCVICSRKFRKKENNEPYI